MPNLLKQLELEELSLVDRPANAQAMVSLFKRDTSGEDMSEETNVDKMSEDMKAKLKPYMDKGMSEDEAMKAYNMDMMKKSEEAPVEEATTEVEAEVEKTEEAVAEPTELDLLKAENERLRKSLIENGFVIKAEAIEKKAEAVSAGEVEMIEVEGEMVAKSDIPTPVLKALEALAVEKADVELTKRAGETLPHFDIKVAKELMKSDLGEEVMAALKAADKLFEGTMVEFGKSDADGEFASANDKINALVKNYMEEHEMKKSQYAIAYAAVAKTDEGKALIAKSYKGE
jgi:hypothetical protein